MLLSIAGGLLIIYCINFIYNYFTFWRHIFKVPSPPGVPILGNSFIDIVSPIQRFERERIYAKTYKNLYCFWGLNLGEFVIYNPDDIEQVLTSNTLLTKGFSYEVLHAWLGTGLLTSTGAKWQRRRKILTPAFHFNILQEFVNIFNKETQKLIEDFEKMSTNNYINVVDPITEFTLNSISETSMGVSLSESTKINNLYKKAVNDLGAILISRCTELLLFIPITYYFSQTKKLEQKALKILHTMTRNVITQRRKLYNENPSYSTRKRLAMLDLLLKYRNEGAEIDDEGICEEVDTFMFEGHDTTSMGLCFFLLILANHQEVQDRILEEIKEVLGENNDQPTYQSLQEMKYLERCIKESLRIFPSVPIISRLATESFTTKTGYYVPKGAMINILIYDLHHREDLYPNPEKFDPDRFLPDNTASRHNFAYVPFSAGPRNCIGQKYAILELKAATCGILRKFKLEPVDTMETVKLHSDLVLRPHGELKVKFVPRTL